MCLTTILAGPGAPLNMRSASDEPPGRPRRQHGVGEAPPGRHQAPPRTTRGRPHTAWLERGWRAKRLEVHRHAPSPAARLPCWCLRRGRACRAWARRPGAAPRPGDHRGHTLFMGTWWPSGRAQPRADSKSARAHEPYGDHDHLGVSVRPWKPPARAHGACRPPPIRRWVVMLMTKF